MVIKA